MYFDARAELKTHSPFPQLVDHITPSTPNAPLTHNILRGDDFNI